MKGESYKRKAPLGAIPSKVFLEGNYVVTFLVQLVQAWQTTSAWHLVFSQVVVT